MRISTAVLFSWLLIFGEALAIEPVGTIGEGALKELSFLPDGKMLRVLRSHVEIVNADSDTVLASFAGKSEPIRRVTVSPDGRRAMVSRRRTVELWDVAAQTELRQLNREVYISESDPVAFAKRGSVLVMDDGVDQLTLWNWETGEPIGRLEDERRPIQRCYTRSGTNWSSTSCRNGGQRIYSIAVSPDDRLLAVGSQRPDVEIWDLETRRLVGHLEGHSDWVTYIAYSPNGRWIATGEPDSTKVYLWNADTRQLVRTWHSEVIGKDYRSDEVIALFFSRDSRRLYVITGGQFPPFTNDRVRVWDVETNVLVNDFRGESNVLRHVSVSPDESRAILQYRNQVAELWDMKHNRRIRQWASYTGGYARLRLSPDGRSLVEAYDTLIKVWDVPSRSLRQIVEGVDNYRNTLAISPDSRRFAVGSWIDGTEIRDIDTGKVQVRFPDAPSNYALAFNYRGDQLAATHDGRDPIIVLDINPPHRRQLLEVEETMESSEMIHITFSRDDRYLAAMDDNKQIHVWAREESGYSYRYSWHSTIYFSILAFHPNATLPILVGVGESVVVWQLGDESAEQLYRIDNGPGRSGYYDGGHFSADGRYLFLNGREGLRIWNWGANTPLRHARLPWYIGVNGDGSVLVTKDEFQRVQVWNVSTLLLPEPMLLGRIKKAELLPNFPNPFNPETWIPYQLSELTDVSIRIHDVSGHQVRVLDLGTKPAGEYLSRSKAAYWDGRNDAGEAVSSGLYFYTLEAEETQTTRRMNLVK